MRKRITDKLLTNYFFLGLINLLFPKAKVIHTQRDPVDTCLSGFTKLFKDDMPHSYDLGELGRYYGKYRELMEHWEKVLPEGFLTTVVYEDVVADTEKEAKRLIEFLGLPWNDEVRRLPQVRPAGEDRQRRPGPQADLQDVGASAGRSMAPACSRWSTRSTASPPRPSRLEAEGKPRPRSKRTPDRSTAAARVLRRARVDLKRGLKSERARTHASRPARGREHPHPARDGRGGRQAR